MIYFISEFDFHIITFSKFIFKEILLNDLNRVVFQY